MPAWLPAAVKWGGIALSMVMAIALIFVQVLPLEDAKVNPIAPLWLYWILLSIGLVAGIFGVVRERQKGPR